MWDIEDWMVLVKTMIIMGAGTYICHWLWGLVGVAVIWGIFLPILIFIIVGIQKGLFVEQEDNGFITNSKSDTIEDDEVYY